MGANQDLGLAPEGVSPKPGDLDLSEGGITKLFTVASLITDDLAHQVEMVALCVVAGWDHNELRRRAGLVPVPDRTDRPYVAPITPRRPQARTIR